MNQLFQLWASASGRAFFALLLLVFAACQPKQTCHDINGRWTNREGRTMIVEPNGEARWVVRFGSQAETFSVKHQYDCKAMPATLDFHEFSWGPLKGRSLFGILEWTSDTSFRYQSDPGTSPSARPTEFADDQAVMFYREKDANQ